MSETGQCVCGYYHCGNCGNQMEEDFTEGWILCTVCETSWTDETLKASLKDRWERMKEAENVFI